MTDTAIEVNDNVTPADAIRNMMDKMADGDVTGAQDSFNSIMNGRADALVSDRKAEIANAIFNNPEMQKMGLEAEAEETEEEQPE